MRRLLIVPLLLGCLLAGGRPAQAGIYNLSDEKDVWPLPTNFHQFQLYRADLLSCDDRMQPAEGKLNKESCRYAVLKQLEGLQAKERANALCTLDRVDLSACLLRLGRVERARAVLEEAQLAQDDPARFLILAHLAVVYHRMGFLPRAMTYQEQALAAWPTNWPGWTPQRTVWYRRAERYYLTLLRLRDRETVRWTAVDDLFPGVKFDALPPRYQAGSMAPQMFDKLPEEAPWMVEQLLVWDPTDERLYWLMGELLNARGDILSANVIFQDLFIRAKLTGLPVLRAHRNELDQAVKAQHAYLTAIEGKPYLGYQVFSALQPRGGLVPPVVGSAAGEACFLLGPIRVQETLATQGGGPGPRIPVEPPPPRLLDWRQITVSFVAGILTAILVRFQIQEWRRRGLGFAPPAEASSPPPPEQPGEPVMSGKSELAP